MVSIKDFMNDDDCSYLYNYYNGKVYRVDYQPASLIVFNKQYQKVSHHQYDDYLPCGDVILSIWFKNNLPCEAYPHVFSASARLNRFKMFNNIVSETMSDVVFPDDQYPADNSTTYTSAVHKERISMMSDTRVAAEPEDLNLYRSFKDNMERMRKTASFKKQLRYTSHTKKTGPCTIDTLPCVLNARFSRKFANCETPFATGILPKLTGKKTDGSVRLVYPMSNSYDYTAAVCFQDLYNPESDDISYVKGPKFPSHKYTYDVNNMDINIYPYLFKYASETNTLDLFLPPAIYAHMVKYPEQMPSGSAYTTLVGQCFTTAIYQQSKKSSDTKCFIQGDGIMTNKPIGHSLLKTEQPYTINGFNYEKDYPRYVNTKKKINSPRYNLHYEPKSIRKKKKQARLYVYLELLHGKEIHPQIHQEEMRNNPFFKHDRDYFFQYNLDVCPRLTSYYYGKQHQDGVYSDTASVITACGVRQNIKICAYDYELINKFYE